MDGETRAVYQVRQRFAGMCVACCALVLEFSIIQTGGNDSQQTN